MEPVCDAEARVMMARVRMAKIKRVTAIS